MKLANNVHFSFLLSLLRNDSVLKKLSKSVWIWVEESLLQAFFTFSYLEVMSLFCKVRILLISVNLYFSLEALDLEQYKTLEAYSVDFSSPFLQRWV